MCMILYVCLYFHVCIWIYIYIHRYTYMQAHTHMNGKYLEDRVRSIRSSNSCFTSWWVWKQPGIHVLLLCMCMFVCLCVCPYVYMNINIHMHIHTYECTHTHTNDKLLGDRVRGIRSQDFRFMFHYMMNLKSAWDSCDAPMNRHVCLSCVYVHEYTYSYTHTDTHIRKHRHTQMANTLETDSGSSWVQTHALLHGEVEISRGFIRWPYACARVYR